MPVISRHRFRRCPKLLAALLLSASTACSRAPASHDGPENAAAKATPAPATPPSVAARVAEAPSASVPSAGATVAEVGSTEPPSPAVGTPAAASGVDFAKSAKELFRVAACGGKGPVPTALDPAIVAMHCTVLRDMYDRYRARWLSRAVPFIAELRPHELPARVVYPFGGGDLVTALAVFPDATEYTTISLEPAGDVRHVDSVTRAELKGALGMNRRHLKKLLGLTYSRTTNLGLEYRAALPGEVVFLMAALAIHGYEPFSLRYFAIADDGSLRYLDESGLKDADAKPHAFGDPPDAAFTNVEIAFRRPDGGPTKIVRHIAQDLSDKELQKSPGLIRSLSAEGRVAGMTKAASHLLWADQFSTIRDYLLAHVDWMISDSTGIPPRFAGPAGFVEDTFGHFDGPAKYGPIEPWDTKDFRKLFAENPRRPLSFQFGYADVHRQIHMIVMRRPERAAG